MWGECGVGLWWKGIEKIYRKKQGKLYNAKVCMWGGGVVVCV